MGVTTIDGTVTDGSDATSIPSVFNNSRINPSPSLLELFLFLSLVYVTTITIIDAPKNVNDKQKKTIAPAETLLPLLFGGSSQ